MTDSHFLDRLCHTLPAGRVRPGAQLDLATLQDWSHEPAAHPLAWVAPQSTPEVATALRLCHAAGVAVVPQGGLTGLAGGANPQAGCIALSLCALNRIENIDHTAATAQVQAGVILQDLQQILANQGLLFGVDLAPRGSCQIGGLIATNAGGSGVIQYGSTRAQILGLEVVLADGAILPMLRALPKNNSGYDLNQIFIGSEGTLGVITRAILRLHPAPNARHTALLALPDFQAALALLQHLRRHLPQSIAAFELMWADYVDAVCSCVELEIPFAARPALTALIEVSGSNDATLRESLEEALDEALTQGWVEDAVIATSLSQASQLWRLRESMPELFRRRQPINFDLSLPIARGGEFVAHCRQTLLTRWPHCDPLFFGHLGDGNLHIIADAAGLPADTPASSLTEAVYALLSDYGGAISAEHGIGSLRRSQLRHCRSTAELATMRALKLILDPKSILNPGKLLPEASA